MNEARRSLLNPLYDVQSPANRASDTMSQASGTFGRMQAGSRTEIEKPGKTIGGGLMSGAGGAASAAMIGTAISTGPVGWGALAAGAGIGLAAYYLS